MYTTVFNWKTPLPLLNNKPVTVNYCFQIFSNNGLKSNEIWRFRGQGSYVRIRRTDTLFGKNPKADYLGFKFSTLQDNSLIFLVGNSTVSFMERF